MSHIYQVTVQVHLTLNVAHFMLLLPIFTLVTYYGLEVELVTSKWKPSLRAMARSILDETVLDSM